MSGGFDAAEFLRDFLTEAAEHLAALEAALLEAERLAGEGRRPGEALVNALFRAIHTLKGMAGMMAFDALAGLAHEVEQLFDDVRHGARHLEQADYGPIFAALDASKRLHARIEATGGEAGEDVTAERAAIVALAQGPADGADLDPYERMARMVEAAKAQVAAEERAAARAAAVGLAGTAAEEGPERATSVRVDTARLDRLMELVGELVIHHTRVAQLGTGLAHLVDEAGPLEGRRDRLAELVAGLDEAMRSVGRVSDELQASTMRVRMVPVRSLFNRFPHIVRDLARDCGKAARVEMAGVDHGLEPPAEREAAGKAPEGTVLLAAAQRGHHIVITVADDGRGIDGAKVLAKALLVHAGGHTYAIPVAAVEETLRVRPDGLRTIKGHAVIEVRGGVLPVFRLADLFGAPAEPAAGAHLPAIVVADGRNRMGLVVDGLAGQQDVVVKPLGDFLGQVRGIGGATILGDGRVALIVDVPTLLERHAAGFHPDMAAR